MHRSSGDVLAVGQAVNIDTGLVEILLPADADSAWVVQEIQRSFPTEVDAVAVDGTALEVVDRTDFADQDLAAKLTRWGIDLHMGTMFGLADQIVLFLIASTLVLMILRGYRMWWQRRPTRGGGGPGRPPPRGALRRAPWCGVGLVLLVAAGIGTALPLLGASLAGFVFSHPSKVDLVAEASAAGFLVHPHVVMLPVELSVRRVAERARRGGHTVPEQKIRERHARLWGHVERAIRLADVAEVRDNSRASAPFRLCARFERGVRIGDPDWPSWARDELRGIPGPP
ncbi:PepSY domain-containing protein [Brachybacterium paraconglomeratum]